MSADESRAILADMKSVDRGSPADQSMLLEALIQAVLGVHDQLAAIEYDLRHLVEK